ncbi:MAG: DUF4388 domain-containing protein [Acidobacteria bacterium]|nr:DUF4388 domain-containing protein [Acidobacteriota bacterium]
MSKDENNTGYDEERLLLKRYLSDEIAPMIFADSGSEIFDVPNHVVAKAIHSWIGDQVSGATDLSASELLFHAAKKIHLLGELELIPREELKQYLESLQPVLMQLCPAEQRQTLEHSLKHLDASTGVSGSTVGVVHRSGGGGGGGVSGGVGSGVLGDVRGGAGTSPVQGGAPPTPGLGAEHSGLHRLNVLLDRLENQPVVAGGAGGAPALGQGVVLAQVVDEVATQAGSGKEFDTQMGFLQDMGVANLGTGVFRVLSQGLPDWAPPPHTAAVGEEPPAGAVRAMQKVVKLSKNSDELMRRFSELVTVAVEEFNEGSLGRTVTMLDLAERMIFEKDVDDTIVKTVIDQTYPNLDQEQLRKLADVDDKRSMLQRVMNFFPKLRVEELLDELQIEERREQRRLLLKLLTVHGDEAREAVTEELQQSLTGANPLPWYVDRNLVYLLRTIPRMKKGELDREIDLLVEASDLSGPLPVVRESLTSLGQLEHVRADKTVAARVSELEDTLLGEKEIPHDSGEVHALLDTAVKLLALSNSPEARAAVVNHGLKRQAQLGDTRARLAKLGAQDLSGSPEILGRIVEALEQELPRRFLGLTMKTQRKSEAIEHFISALSGTETPEVRQLLNDIALKHSGQDFAAAAARALTALGRAPAESREEKVAAATLTGDLALFGLPNLLQNLADTGVTGTLTLIDPEGNSTAAVELVEGAMISASAGKLSNEIAVYQLLERPVTGRFVFVNMEGAEEAQAKAENAHSVMSLLLEGMRRYDEFSRAVSLVPDEARFEPGKKKPTDVKEDSDPNLAKKVWGEAARGIAPAICEPALAVDSYRVRRLYEHWVTEGSLVPKT